jgi:hypothetical protein
VASAGVGAPMTDLGVMHGGPLYMKIVPIAESGSRHGQEVKKQKHSDESLQFRKVYANSAYLVGCNSKQERDQAERDSR